MSVEQHIGITLHLYSNDPDNFLQSGQADVKPNLRASSLDASGVDVIKEVAGNKRRKPDVKPTMVGHGQNNNAMTMEQLWSLYLAGKVNVDPTEESSKNEGFDSKDWELVKENDAVVAILCQVCRRENKDPQRIRGDTLEKLRNFGEQHLVHCHQRVPKGFPDQVGPRPFQCKLCSLYFRGENLLKKHRPHCSVEERKVDVKAVPSNGVSPGKVESSTDEPARKRKMSVQSEVSPRVKPERSARKTTRSPVEPESSDDDSPPPVEKPKKRQKPGSKPGAKKSKPSVENEDSMSLPQDDPSPVSKKKTTQEDAEKLKKASRPSAKASSGAKADCQEFSNAILPVDTKTLGNRWLERDKNEPHSGFNCPLCKCRPLSKPIFIEDHVAAIHFKQKRYICVLCKRAGNDDPSWSHKTSLDEHLRKDHSLAYSRREKINFDLMEVQPLLPDVVNTMRLFFKMYPKAGEEIKAKYLPKKPNTGGDNNKKSKCPECDQKFYTQEERTLIDHIMWRHRNAPRYHCHYCGDSTAFGMVAGFEDHCKREHGCEKADYVQIVFMKVDRVPEDLAKMYYIDDNEYQDLHKGREIVSDDEEDSNPPKEENIPTKMANLRLGFRRKEKEMFLSCQMDDCDWSISSRELYIVDKINAHNKTHDLAQD